MPTTPVPADRGAERTRRLHWGEWVALAWASWFGLLYGRMVLDERAPTVLAAIERAAEPFRAWWR